MSEPAYNAAGAWMLDEKSLIHAGCNRDHPVLPMGGVEMQVMIEGVSFGTDTYVRCKIGIPLPVTATFDDRHWLRG